MASSEVSVFTRPGGYRFVWPGEKVEIEVRRLADDRRTQSTSAEIVVKSVDPTDPGHLHRSRINLTSTQAKKTLASTLRTFNDAYDWPVIVETLCETTLDMHREGEPLQFIGDLPLSGGVKYRLWPICPEGMPALIFGEGGTGKSFIALLMAVMVQTGHASLGLRPTQGNALYLDYETSADTQNERVRAICAGMNIPLTQIAYRYCYHPLAEDIEAIQEMIADKGIAFLIVDSLGPACGGDPNEAELAIRMFNALRQLHCATLLIDHIAKNLQQGQQASPYGSVYKLNLARSVWQIKPAKGTEGYDTRVALYHRKVNFGPLRKDALGFGLDFVNNQSEQLVMVKVQSVGVSDDAELIKGLSCKQQVYAILKDGRKTFDEIAEMSGRKEPGAIAVLRSTLSREGKAGRLGEWDDEWGILSKDKP